MRILHRFWYRGEDATGARTFVGEVALIVDNGKVTDLLSQFPGAGLVIVHSTPCHWDSDTLTYVCDEPLRLFIEQELRQLNARLAAEGKPALVALTPVEVQTGERPYGFYEQDITGHDLPDFLSPWPSTLLGAKPFEVPMPTVGKGDDSL
jgi:hypothetical protein